MLLSGATRMGIAAVYTPASKYKVYWSLILAEPDDRQGVGRLSPRYRFLQKRGAQHRVEFPVVVGDLLALADVAAGDGVAVAQIGVGRVGMVHVVVVVGGEQDFAVDPIAVLLDEVARRLRQLGELFGRIEAVEAFDEAPILVSLRMNWPANTPSPWIGLLSR